MDKEKDRLLCERFPKLYADRNGDATQTCMCWGFCTGDGWFDIILRLSEKLEAMIEKDPKADHQPRASQVKEKFGTLRFYMDYSTNEMEEAIEEAMAESARTCEECGKPGELNTKGWLVTLCDGCDVDRKKRNKRLREQL